MKKRDLTSLSKNTKCPDNYYVNPSEMWDEMDAYYNLGDDQPISISLGLMLEKISKKIAYMPKFINYPYREEMEADAKLQMITKLTTKKFKLWARYKIIMENDTHIVYEKKDVVTKEMVEVSQKKNDEIIIEDGYAVMKNNPFSYFSRIAYICFISRIKKEKKQEETIKNYQEHIYEQALTSGNGWENVRRPKYLEGDEEYYEQ